MGKPPTTQCDKGVLYKIDKPSTSQPRLSNLSGLSFALKQTKIEKYLRDCQKMPNFASVSPEKTCRCINTHQTYYRPLDGIFNQNNLWQRKQSKT